MPNTVILNGRTYTDDSDPTTGLGNGGHRIRFVAALADYVIDVGAKQTAAAASAATASAQAVIATNQAAAASGSAGTATAQAGIATTQAGTATTQAGIATAQAGIATTQANLAADWALKLTGPVSGGEYSAKYWAQYAGSLATGQLIYMGTWDASAGTYPPAQVKGAFWKVSVAGVVSTVSYEIGDNAIYNGVGWDKVDNSELVTSVAGKVGAVTLVKADVGLGNVDNTSDANKPVSTAQAAGDAAAQAAAIAASAPVAHVGAGGTAHAIAVAAGAAGFMTGADKTKLNGIAVGATDNTGTVTGVTATAPVVSTGGATPAISMAAATAAVPGYLTAADWGTFNSKQAALGFTPYNSTNPAGYITSAGTSAACSGNAATATTATNVATENPIAPTLLNGWLNYDASTAQANYWKDALGMVHVRGFIKSGTMGAPAFTLPVGYRPLLTESVPCSSQAQYAYTNIDIYGNVTPQVGATTWFSINLSFKAG